MRPAKVIIGSVLMIKNDRYLLFMGLYLLVVCLSLHLELEGRKPLSGDVPPRFFFLSLARAFPLVC